MEWIWWSVAIALAAVAIDRVLLAVEARGWIYWRRRKASGGSAAAAMLATQSLFEPAAEQTVVEDQRREAIGDPAGDDEPLDPG